MDNAGPLLPALDTNIIPCLSTISFIRFITQLQNRAKHEFKYSSVDSIYLTTLIFTKHVVSSMNKSHIQTRFLSLDFKKPRTN